MWKYKFIKMHFTYSTFFDRDMSFLLLLVTALCNWLTFIGLKSLACIMSRRWIFGCPLKVMIKKLTMFGLYFISSQFVRAVTFSTKRFVSLQTNLSNEIHVYKDLILYTHFRFLLKFVKRFLILNFTTFSVP